MIQSDRGSMWRRWDLQVHTPFSHLNNSFNSDFPTYFRSLLQRATDHQIAAVGVTDYFTIEGYAAACKLLADEEFLESIEDDKVRNHARRILLLPNVELRTNFLIQGKDGKDSRVNMHVIFSDEVSCADIEEHFFREVKFWAEAEPQRTAARRSLTNTNLADLGQQLKAQHAKFADKSDLYVGMMNAVIDAHEVAKVLADHSAKFEHKYIIAFPCDEDLSTVSWDGQGHLSRKQYIQMADVLFSSNDNTRRFGLGKTHSTQEEYLAEFKSLKPCLHSSDAHSEPEMFEPAEGRYAWIKADVTFEGLRQVLHEPEHRVFIGEMPEQRRQVMAHPTKYIKSVSIKQAAGAKVGETWFSDQTLPLSPELVAIIGKKGSGKSALSDLIGFVGHSNQYEHFSFLNARRFWNDSKKRARSFEVSLTWIDQKEATRILSDDRVLGATEAVKYIPQNYLELICNEIDQGSDSSFQRELQEVIFSHIEPALRMGSTTLIELIRSKNSAIDERLALFKAQLRDVNAKIIDLEVRGSPMERVRINSLLDERKREIAAHNESRPPDEPVDSTKEEAALSAVQQSLSDAQAKLGLAEKEVAGLTAARAAQLTVVSECLELSASLDNLEIGVRGLMEKVSERAQRLSIRSDELVQLKIKRELVSARQAEAEKIIKEHDGKLNASATDSPVSLLASILKSVEDLQKKLSEPEKRRQAALQVKAAWNKRSAELVGSTEIPGSLKHLESRLIEFDAIPAQQQVLASSRDSLLLSLYDSIADLAHEYQALFKPVQAYFEAHKEMYPEVSIDFVVTQRVKGFTSGLLGLLDQSKRGAFRGAEEGQKTANELVSTADVQSREGILAFVRGVMSKLEEAPVEDQVARGRSKSELFNFVFDLDYLRPRFELRWDGKPPEQLSPGERGSLLLVFYLVLDMRRCPLVIDQPEENLDNETIFRILVPCIMFAKRHRQVIMVTHNPNLAVAADADQIIYASVVKEPSIELKYESGSIENAKMTTHIINVLEGTKPAFKKREARYDSRY